MNPYTITKNNQQHTGPDFFVIGLQKSGSYWVTALLDAHPEINCFPSLAKGKTGIAEGHIFDTLGSIDEDGGKQARTFFSSKHNGFFRDLVPHIEKLEKSELYALFAERYSEWIDLHRTKKLAGDKTVEYVFFLDMIDEMFPHIKKICILRDPKDRIVSFHFHQLRKGQKTEQEITDAYIEKYLTRIEQEYGALLSYNEPICCITYESLTNEPDNTVSKMLSYLGVARERGQIQTMIHKASFSELVMKDVAYGEKTHYLTKIIHKIFNPLSKRLASQIAKGVLRLIALINSLLITLGFHKEKVRTQGQELGSSHYRKGIIGDWKNHLSEKQADRIDERTKKLHQKVLDTHENLLRERP